MSGSESAQGSGSESRNAAGHASESTFAHAAGSSTKSATGSGAGDEATSSKSVPAPRNDDPTPVADELNRWDVNEEIVQEFYAIYAATLRGSISKRSKPLAQDPLTSTMVRGCPVDISPTTISYFLYGPTTGHSWYISADDERAEWVATPQLGIRKATLNFVAKFFWLLVRNRVSPTKADNQLTWDRSVMVAALVEGVEIDFARMLLAKIHERAFKTSTTYPFPCLIFKLCRDSGVPIWHCDRLIHPTGELYIGLIRDEANVAAPHREPQVEVPPLGADLANTVGQAQGGDPSIPDHTATVLASSSQAASMAPSSSRSIPQLGAIVVPLARVQKLEAQMATLWHHIQPWMQKTIVEFEAKMERMMEGMMDRKVQAVNKHLDAFELRVLEQSAPAIDLSSLQAELASLQTDVDAILAAPTVEPQAAPVALADNTVLDALFSRTTEEGLEPTHATGKRHHSSRTEEEKAQKRQHRQEKEARKASLLDEDLHQRKVRESATGASSSTPVVEVPPVVRDVVSTTDGAMMDDVGTTEGDPTIVPAGSGKPDSPARS
uniref:Integrase core domain containing protein n=1 Tax=Solanum tuberosum TaxID=4113 RepID=M1DWY2_SOLTU